MCIPVLRVFKPGSANCLTRRSPASPIIVAAELWTGVKKNLATHPQQAAKLAAFLDLFAIADFT